MGTFMLHLAIALAVPSGPAPAAATTATFGPDDTETPFVCSSCVVCPEDPNKIGHGIGTGAPNNREWLVQFYCPNGLGTDTCEDLPECDGGQHDVEDLQLAADTGDPREFVELLERPGVSMVAERGAIQVMDCRGRVAYHLRLDADVLSRVVELADR